MPSSQSSVPFTPLQVFTGSNYLTRQEKTKHRWAVFLVVPIVIIWVISMALSLVILATAIPGLRERVPWGSLPSWVNIVALGMILLDYALLPVLERLVQERDQYRLGRRGEEAVVKELQQHLDGEWTLFRNFVLPGKQADIDGVLVGPSGVYALEIKSYRGRFRNRGDQWWWGRYRPGWRRLTANPSRQAKANAARLNEYLHDAIGEKIWVEARVVWVGPGTLHIQRPAVYIWFLAKMATYAAELLKSPPKPQSLIRRVWEVLMEVVQDEGRKQDA